MIHNGIYLLQCTGSANPGVCSDTTQGGNEDIETLETSAFQGVVRARFKRRLDTGEKEDGIDDDGTSIRRKSVGAMSNWCWS